MSAEHEPLRHASVELATGPPDRVLKVLPKRQRQGCRLTKGDTRHAEAARAAAAGRRPQRLQSVLLSTYDRAPEHFEGLLGLQGVGGRTPRALTLVSEVIWGTPANTRDPARFAFAQGGKDGTPFPVDRETYDRTIDVLARAMSRARIDRSEKGGALKQLGTFAKTTEPAKKKAGP